jgi:hypothetical protein
MGVHEHAEPARCMHMDFHSYRLRRVENLFRFYGALSKDTDSTDSDGCPALGSESLDRMHPAKSGQFDTSTNWVTQQAATLVSDCADPSKLDIHR